LLREGIDEETLAALENAVDEEIRAAVEYAIAAPDPEPSDTYTHVYAERGA
jgi:TPP-dependent pyruvate/acetoin dehydrogenase alpha subunit